MNKGLIAITFPNINGANQMLDALNKSIQGDITQISDVLIIEKDKDGNLKTKKTPRLAKGTPACGDLNFVVGLLLRGSVAKDLLGKAAGTLLHHQIDLGIAPQNKDKLTADMDTNSSVLFLQDCSRLNGTFEAVFNQADGKLHDLSMSESAIQDVQIMSSTLNYYWN